jgi:hypothetical protein
MAPLQAKGRGEEQIEGNRERDHYFGLRKLQAEKLHNDKK